MVIDLCRAWSVTWFPRTHYFIEDQSVQNDLLFIHYCWFRRISYRVWLWLSRTPYFLPISCNLIRKLMIWQCIDETEGNTHLITVLQDISYYLKQIRGVPKLELLFLAVLCWDQICQTFADLLSDPSWWLKRQCCKSQVSHRRRQNHH